MSLDFEPITDDEDCLLLKDALNAARVLKEDSCTIVDDLDEDLEAWLDSDTLGE